MYHQPVTLLKAMSHPVRLHILDILRDGECCVCHIETALHKRQAYVSQQLMTLRDAGLVENRKAGLQVYYRLTDSSVHSILETLLGSRSQAAPPLHHCPCPNCQPVQEVSVC